MVHTIGPAMSCSINDALLSQDISACVGIIIKNEVLFRVSGCHQVAQLLLRQWSSALRATRPEPSQTFGVPRLKGGS